MRGIFTVLADMAAAAMVLCIGAAIVFSAIDYVGEWDTVHWDLFAAITMGIFFLSLIVLAIAEGLRPLSERERQDRAARVEIAHKTRPHPRYVWLWMLAGALAGTFAALVVAHELEVPDESSLGYRLVGMLVGAALGPIGFWACRHFQLNRAGRMFHVEPVSAIVTCLVLMYLLARFLFESGLGDVLLP